MNETGLVQLVPRLCEPTMAAGGVGLDGDRIRGIGVNALGKIVHLARGEDSDRRGMVSDEKDFN